MNNCLFLELDKNSSLDVVRCISSDNNTTCPFRFDDLRVWVASFVDAPLSYPSKITFGIG